MRVLKYSFTGLLAFFTVTAATLSAMADGGDDAFGVGASLGVMVQHPVIIPRVYVAYEIKDWIGVILEGRFAPRDPGYLWSAATGLFVRGAYQHIYGKASLTGGLFSTMGRAAHLSALRGSQPDMLTLYGELSGSVGYVNTEGNFFVGPQFGVGLQPKGGVIIGKNWDLLTYTGELSVQWRIR